MAARFLKAIFLGLAINQASLVCAQAIEHDIRYMGADLIDEMLADWKKKSPLLKPAHISLVEVIAPIGLDEGFAILMENRLFEVLELNPDIELEMIHCSECRSLVVKSSPKRTYMGHGFQDSDVLAKLAERDQNLKGLSILFEAEGRNLVLRATLFELKPGRRIRWAMSYITSRSARRALQSGEDIVTLEEARARQDAIIAGRDPLELTTRMTIRFFTPKNVAAQAQPLLFVEQSFEAVVLPNRKFRLGLDLGFTSIRNVFSGWSAGGHMSWLLFADKPNLSSPDLYWFFGFHHTRLRGPGAEAFGDQQLDLERIINEGEPRASLIGYRLGLEAHIKYRFGLMTFIEFMPLLKDSPYIAAQSLGGIPYHCIGMGLVLRW